MKRYSILASTPGYCLGLIVLLISSLAGCTKDPTTGTTTVVGLVVESQF